MPVRYPSATSGPRASCPRRARASGVARQCRPRCRGSRPSLACGGRWRPRPRTTSRLWRATPPCPSWRRPRCATARIDLCVRVSSDASVRHVEEHRVGIDCALEDGEVVDGVPAYEGVAWGRAWWRRLWLLLLEPLLAVPPSILFSPHARGLVVCRLMSCFMIRVCPWWPGGARRCAASGSRSGGRPLRCCGWRRRRRNMITSWSVG